MYTYTLINIHINISKDRFCNARPPPFSWVFGFRIQGSGIRISGSGYRFRVQFPLVKLSYIINMKANRGSATLSTSLQIDAARPCQHVCKSKQRDPKPSPRGLEIFQDPQNPGT